MRWIWTGAACLCLRLPARARSGGLAADNRNWRNMSVERIGVVGAGTMGIGVSQAFADAGCHVTLVDNRESALDRAREEIARNVKVYALLRKSAPVRSISEVL